MRLLSLKGKNNIKKYFPRSPFYFRKIKFMVGTVKNKFLFFNMPVDVMFIFFVKDDG